MTEAQTRTQFAMKVILPEQLMLGLDIRNVSQYMKDTLLNRVAIGINQGTRMLICIRSSILFSQELDCWILIARSFVQILLAMPVDVGSRLVAIASPFPPQRSRHRWQHVMLQTR
jgi:hypothetical protein